MSVVLARVDDRFIHGQVTVGWSRVLNPDRIILCNDDIAADSWQSRVYASSVPPRMQVLVLSRQETCELLDPADTDDNKLRTIVLVGSPADMLDLKRGGLDLPEVNIGGMHHQSGKRVLDDQIYVDQFDIDAMRGLLSSGVDLQSQTVPGAPVTTISEFMLDSAQEQF
jgi:mannose/fructose/N-acetylgalactosamine-specific phosphotransferase system component IIB